MKPGSQKKNNMADIDEPLSMSRQRQIPALIDDEEHQIQEEDNSSENMDSDKKKNDLSDMSDCVNSEPEDSCGEEESEGLTQQKEKCEQHDGSDLKDDKQFLKQSRNQTKRQRTGESNSLFTSGDIQNSGDPKGTRLMDGQDKTNAHYTDTFIKELDDDFCQIEDQLFNEDDEEDEDKFP